MKPYAALQHCRFVPNRQPDGAIHGFLEIGDAIPVEVFNWRKAEDGSVHFDADASTEAMVMRMSEVARS